MEMVDIEYELKLLNLDNPNYEFWNKLSDQAIKNIAKRYRLDESAVIFNIVWNWEHKLSRKQRWLIIAEASNQEKQFWI
jgi:hypothetical protein